MNSAYNFNVMRVLRRRMNLTLEELARISGLTYTTVEAVETNKTQPSLKTLDALAGALRISTSSLVGMAERRLVQRRRAEYEASSLSKHSAKGMENCRVARYGHGKLICVNARAGELVHVMGLHEDIHEFCYVISGIVELTIEEKVYRLTKDETILFDGVLDHSYLQIEDGQYITVHIPKDIRSLAGLLEEADDVSPLSPVSSKSV